MNDLYKPPQTQSANASNQLAANMIYCQGCGKQIHKTAPMCPHCGAPQSAGKNLKNKTTAAVLALILGGLGIHRFYLGQWWGIFYILFSWTLIPGLIAFIEFIVFLCTSPESWDRKYNKGIPSGGSSGGIIVLAVIGVFIIVAMLGIVAAVALPAYQDYTTRAKISQTAQVITKILPNVTAHIEEKQEIPESLESLGLPTNSLPADVKSVEIDQGSGVIKITMQTPRQIENKFFEMVPTLDKDRHISWSCVPGDVPPRLLPLQCRGGRASTYP